MNHFAALYAIKKIVTLYENKLDEVKNSMKETYLIDIPEELPNTNVREFLAEKGFCRVNFGGVRGNMYNSGDGFAILFSQFGANEKESASFKSKADLVHYLGLKKKDKPSVSEILSLLEDEFQGLTRLAQIEIKESKTIATKRGKEAPLIGDAIDAIDDKFYQDKCNQMLETLDFKSSSAMRDFDIMKSAEKELAAISKHMLEYCTENFEENNYITFSSTEKIVCNEEKLMVLRREEKWEGLNGIINHKEASTRSKTTVIKWAGSINDIDGSLSLEFEQALDLILMQSKSMKSDDSRIFSSSQESLSDEPIKSRLNL